jgi:DNA repair protein RecN (Recombination protein N)
VLQQLNINNYALIDQLSINFSNGFSVITGETGSGKSIILGALSMLTGDRADVKSLRNKENKCIIEGEFILPNTTFYQDFFKSNDVDFSENTIIRREINPQGKSRSFINDTPVNLQVVKELGDLLIDIHSQHENAVLNDRNFLFKIVDEHAHSQAELEDYQKTFLALKKQQDELKLLEQREEKAQHEKDYITFLLAEFEGFPLEKILTDDIESEYNTLANAEEIKLLSNEVLSAIDEGNFSINNQLHTALNSLQKLSKISVHYEELTDRINSCLIELKDISADLSRKTSSIEVDNRKLVQLEETISTLNKLIKKHNVRNAEELLAKREELSQSIQGINSLSSSIQTIKLEITQLEKELQSKGVQLRKKRNQVFSSIETNINALLVKMNMKNASIKLHEIPLDKPILLGLDDLQILVRTNLGSAFEPLKKIASGGELSRIMLAIKSLQSQQNAIPTIIFDEIDTGVSGEVANAMGIIMKQLSREMQVVSITHLPQIAGKGEHHYKVYKEEKNNITHTHLIKLDTTLRVQEIAEMISGKNPSESAIANAKELLVE